MSLRVGDVVDIVKRGEPGGWTVGRLRASGRLGSFPTDFVEFLSPGAVGPAPLTAQQRNIAVAAATKTDDPFAGLEPMSMTAKPVAAPKSTAEPQANPFTKQAAKPVAKPVAAEVKPVAKAIAPEGGVSGDIEVA